MKLFSLLLLNNTTKKTISTSSTPHKTITYSIPGKSPRERAYNQWEQDFYKRHRIYQRIKSSFLLL